MNEHRTDRRGAAWGLAFVAFFAAALAIVWGERRVERTVAAPA